MEILAHGLWTGAVAKGVNKKLATSLNAKQTIFWGIFPDIFGFIVLSGWFIIVVALGKLGLIDIFNYKVISSVPRNPAWLFRDVVPGVYSITHSFIIFGFMFLGAYMFCKRPVWELLGWPFHIVIDIFTHSADFNPTPFLWPLQSPRVNGVTWYDARFTFINYGLIIFVYILLWAFRKRKPIET